MKNMCEDLNCVQQLMGFLSLDGRISKKSVEAAVRAMYPVLVGGQKQLYGTTASSKNQGIAPESELPLGLIFLELHDWLVAGKSPISGAALGHRYWLKVLLLIARANERLSKSTQELRVFPYKDVDGSWVYVVGKSSPGSNEIEDAVHVNETKLESELLKN